MKKRVFKIFFNFLENQETWLNSMSKKGYRLVKASRFFYYFEESTPNKYKYTVQFIMDKTNKELKNYYKTLQDLDMNYFTKNVNIGKFSFAEIKVRPYIKNRAMLATSPGRINKELLILEKLDDGKPFKIYNNTNELIEYFKNIRNTFAFTDLFLLVFLISLLIKNSTNLIIFIIYALLVLLIVLSTTSTIKYNNIVNYYKDKENLYQ